MQKKKVRGASLANKEQKYIRPRETQLVLLNRRWKEKLLEWFFPFHGS